MLLVHQGMAVAAGPPDSSQQAAPAAAAPAVDLSGIATGVRRDRTEHFRELRALYIERRRSLAGPRLPWLSQIFADRDAKALGRFVETGRAPQDPDGVRGCAWCNHRIVAPPKERRTSSRGDSAAAKSAAVQSSAAGAALAACCEVCHKWYCQKCRSYSVDLMSLMALANTSVPGPHGAGSAQQQRQNSVELRCCISCSDGLEAARWHCESPPLGLARSSGELLAVHGRLAVLMTAFPAALAQCEGLVRLAEMHRDAGTLLPDECLEALHKSRSAASESLAALEAVLRDVKGIVCDQAGAPRRDVQLREALARHGKFLVEQTKPRLHTAIARANTVAPVAQALPSALRRMHTA